MCHILHMLHETNHYFLYTLDMMISQKAGKHNSDNKPYSSNLLWIKPDGRNCSNNNKI